MHWRPCLVGPAEGEDDDAIAVGVSSSSIFSLEEDIGWSASRDEDEIDW